MSEATPATPDPGGPTPLLDLVEGAPVGVARVVGSSAEQWLVIQFKRYMGRSYPR
jgi:hypothetical protein